ncbi:hypothetical protein, partial [Lactococcus lactis]|uniref:hypothetical protein n=1 Tax=Lactococcus lactis TaxID=1358 RepID=UPI003D0DBE3F
MAFTVTFNGVDLTALGLEVERGLERNIGTTRTVELEKRGRQRGKDFLYTTAEEKTITMPFRLNTNLVDKRRVLEAAL